MKKLFKICVLFIALMAVPAFLFAGGETDGQSGAVQKIQEAGKLVMGTEAQYAPYEFKDKDANIVGCDIYIAEKIAEALGVELEVVDMAFDGIIPAVQSGQVDVGIAAFTNTPERAQVIDFSSIYEESLQYLVVQAGNEDVYTSADALKGLKVGAQRGTIQSQLIKKVFPESELFELAKYPELSLEVQNGNIAGLVVDAAVGDSIIASSDGKLVKANYTFDSKEATFGKSVVVKKGNADLLEVVNSVVETIVADGSYQKAYDEAVALQKELGL